MAVTRKYRLNLRNYGAPPSIQVSQYDEGYALVFEIYDGPSASPALNAYDVKLRGVRSDTLAFEFDGVVSGTNNNILSFTIDTTMTGYPGRGVAEVAIIDSVNDVLFASFNLPVYIEKAARPNDAIDADVERAQDLAEQCQEIVDTAKEEVEAGLIDVKEDLDEYADIFTGDVAESVQNWLDAHPEATTTVQDGSITESKFTNALKQKTINSYVTPEMFGAVGDGVTDDTTAFQNALDSGKPVVLKNDANYYIGTVTFTEAVIIGNGSTITNNDDDTLLSGTTLYIENVNIVNPSIFDYQTGIDPFACIYTVNCYALNVTMTEVNRIGIWLNNGVIDGFNVSTTFDVGANYDGSSNNNLYGVYFDQQETSKHIEVKNSTFKNLIEGIYVGTTNDDWKFTASIHDNHFDTIGDHCAYINSLNDRCACEIYNNVAEKVTSSFVLGGNNIRLHDNIIYGGYVSSIRQTFGFSIRNGSNIKIDHNRFVLNNYTSSNGMGASIGITSLVSMTVMENIIFEENEFYINELNTTMPWIRIGYNQNVPVKNLRFERNKFVLTGHSSIFSTNVSIDGFIFIDNDIKTDKNCFDATMTMPLTVINNRISNNGQSSTFGFNVCGEWYDNKFDCAALPIRKASDNEIKVRNNTNASLSGSVYNTISAKNWINYDVLKGEFTSTSQSTAVQISHPTALFKAFYKHLLVMDSNYQPVSYTVNNVVNGTISINIAAGSYYYTII